MKGGMEGETPGVPPELQKNPLEGELGEIRLVDCKIKKIGLNNPPGQRLVIKLKDDETGDGASSVLGNDKFAIFFNGPRVDANNLGGNAFCFKHDGQMVLINYKTNETPKKAKLYLLREYVLENNEFKFGLSFKGYEKKGEELYREQMMKGLFFIESLLGIDNSLFRLQLKFCPPQFLLDVAYGKTFIECRMTFKELLLSLKILDEVFDCGRETDEESFISCNDRLLALLESDVSKRFSLAENIILKLQGERIGVSQIQTHGERGKQFEVPPDVDEYTTESFKPTRI